MQASSAISFRLPPASISAAASFRLTVFRLSASLRPDVPRPVAASDQLSSSAVFAFFRPLQFWVLTTQPLFLPFPLLPGFASHCFSGARFPSRFPVFSLRPAWFPMPSSGYRYLAFCLFPFTHSCFAPTAALQAITFCFRFWCFSLSRAFFRPLGSGSCYSDFRFSLFPSSRFPLTVVLPVPIYPPSVCLFPCALPVLVLSMLHLPFTGFLLRHTAATATPLPRPFGFGHSP